jgi:hypothetical protein
MNEETGPHGTAVELPIPDVPEAFETVCHWLITSESYHPFWTQWTLVVVRLREVRYAFCSPRLFRVYSRVPDYVSES